MRQDQPRIADTDEPSPGTSAGDFQEGGLAPLSFSQRRLWFLEALHPGGTAYNVPQIIAIHGLLDVVALERSLARIVARHEALRTRVVLVDGEPMQLILDEMPLSLVRVQVEGQGEVAKLLDELMD